MNNKIEDIELDVRNIHNWFELDAERLQTLPDGWTAGVSNTQRYKAIGNGWTVDVIAWIFSQLPTEQ